ncbi:hypothetical protein MRB53_015276 [Persea americana]|uniref:Uncharacterized protein n=1 Tax=Persea americana TaxID=3435 RepID=A0ACC2KDR9_PERAE|nr:hypothetical protein MRB53_015276 [Persea americana]
MASLQSAITPGLNHLTSGRSQSQIRSPSHLLPKTTLGHGFCSLVNQKTLQWAVINHRMCCSITCATMGDNHQSNAPQPKKPKPVWFNWVLGWIFSMILPFANLKGGNLLRLAGPLKQIEEVVEEVEEVVEIVEKVAEGVEKVSSELAENIPDNEMLKGTALAVEKLSKEVEKDAKLTMELMHKVDDIKGEVEKELEPAAGEVAGKGSGHGTEA